MAKKEYSIDMVNGPLTKNVIRFTVPLMLTSLLQMCFNTADTIVVGRFAGDNALAAVGATGSLCFLMVTMFNGLAMGANVVIAKFFGAEDRKGVENSVHTAMLLSLISGVLLTLVGVLCAEPLLKLMQTPDSIIGQSLLYLRIYFGGALFFLVYNFGAAVLRSKGDTRRPLYFLAISGVLNVVLNLIFVIVFHWGVAGVATATVASNALSSIFVVITLLKENDATRIYPSRLKLNAGITKEILRIGIPAGIQGAMFALSNLVIQSSINSFGSETIVAGNSAAANIENFVYVGMNFTSATMTFISQNIGARKYNRIGKITGVTMALNAGCAAFISLSLYMFGKSILGLYTTSPDVVSYGMIRMTWVCLFLWLNGVMDVFLSALRGMGHSTMPTVSMIVCICGFRLVWLFTVFRAVRTLPIIYYCFPISWVLTSVVLGVMWICAYKKLKRKPVGQI
ncbi:MAG: MATE family efflux transporter [Clostridia bacterium]|nr:MATE family efflux transporter [Clostridia bacterium]